MNGIIAAGHQETARAGAQILQAGGNAIDAALAAMLASFAAESSLTSLGGGGFCTVYTASGQAYLFDFFVQTPRHKRPLEELDWLEAEINFGTTSQAQYIGKGTVAVPGCPAGLFRMHELLGSLPLAEIAAPAIALCRKGVRITPYQAYSLEILTPILLHSPEIKAIFAHGGHLLGEGEVSYRPLLAETLAHLVEEGARAFYEGEIGQKFAKDSLESGGNVSLTDLQAYQVQVGQPLSFSYRGHTLLTNPPPSTGGSMICYGLGQLAPQTLHPPRGNAYLRQLSQVFQAMEHFRRDYYQARLPDKLNPKEYLSKAFLAAHRPSGHPLGNTTHLSAMDRAGNAVSLTTTIGGASGHCIPGTGIPSNNMLGELDLSPGGVYAWRENQRVSSMMSPSILLRNGQPWVALGTGGSSRIRSAILQVILNLVDHGMGLEAAINFPRLHWENHLINLEPGLTDAPDSLPLSDEKLIIWAEKNMYFGGVHCVACQPNGALIGHADARRDGAALAG